MARSYAPIYTSIWHDPEFTRRSALAQRVYLLAFSQPDISYCGVVSYTARRWAGLAPDTTPKAIDKAVHELADAGFLTLDPDTEEMWIRSFVKYNGVLDQPQLKKAMQREFRDIHSPQIRAAFRVSLPEKERGALHHPADRLPEGCGQGASSLFLKQPEAACLGIDKSVEGSTDTEPEPSSSSALERQPDPDPGPDDDEASVRIEAKQRLAEREAKLGPVGDVDAWLEAAKANVRKRRAASSQQRKRIDDCPVCHGDGVVERPDGTYARCQHEAGAA